MLFYIKIEVIEKLYLSNLLLFLLNQTLKTSRKLYLN